MRRPPPLTALLRYPVTTGTGLLAIAATILWLSGRDIGALTMDLRAWYGEPWRLITSALPHVDVLHLLFNVYWLWVFGTVIERAFRPWRTLAMFIFLAAGSTAAEYAVFEGGVGLSGVGYGLFAFLWIAGPRDERFRDAVDRRTVQLFVAWFLLCVILTYTGTWQVANVAHLAGAILGIGLAGTLVSRAAVRRRIAASFAVSVLLITLAATWLRPAINLSEHGGQDAAWCGYQALIENENERSVRFLTIALQMDPRQPDWWFNLGIARQRLEQLPAALAAFEQAAALAPENTVMTDTAAQMKRSLSK